MTESDPLIEDLRFVRRVVESRNRPPRRIWQMQCYWAAYLLAGFTLVDFQPAMASWFFVPGAVVGFLANWYCRKRADLRHGEADHASSRRIMLFWFGCLILSLGAIAGLAFTVPALQNEAGGRILSQFLVILFGLQYFSYGVLEPDARHLRWAGPILVAGGVCVGLLPRHGWTALGVVMAACLLVPLLSPTRPADRS